MGTCKARNRIEKDHNITPTLHERLCSSQDEFGESHVVAGHLIERRTNHFAGLARQIGVEKCPTLTSG